MIIAMPIVDSRKAPGSNVSWLGGSKGQVYDTPHHFYLRSKGVCVFFSEWAFGPQTHFDPMLPFLNLATQTIPHLQGKVMLTGETLWSWRNRYLQDISQCPRQDGKLLFQQKQVLYHSVNNGKLERSVDKQLSWQGYFSEVWCHWRRATKASWSCLWCFQWTTLTNKSRKQTSSILSLRGSWCMMASQRIC